MKSFPTIDHLLSLFKASSFIRANKSKKNKSFKFIKNELLLDILITRSSLILRWTNPCNIIIPNTNDI